MGKKKEKENRKKKSKRIYRTSQNIRIINVFLESLLSESSLSLGVHLTSLGCPPTLCCSLDLLGGWGSSDSCLQCPQLSELVHFLLWELSISFYIFHRHRACLVDWVDLICSLYSLWEGFGSSSLATLPLGFHCSFTSTSACGLSTAVCSWGYPGRLGSAPVRASCGGGAAAWVHRDSGRTRYSGELVARASRKYSALEGYGNQYWPIRSSILAWRTPLTEKPGRLQSTGSQRVRHNSLCT